MLEKYRIKIYPLNKLIFAKKDELLYNVLLKHNIQINGICGGNGVCGKCYVKILNPLNVAISEQDKKFLDTSLLNDNYRLSCTLKINSNLIIEIPSRSYNEESKILDKGNNVETEVNPIINIKEINYNIKSEEILYEKIKNELKNDKVILNTPQTLNNSMDGKNFYTIYLNNEILDLKEDDNIYGIAFDIGTTTIVGALINLRNGKIIYTASRLNAQQKFGADIISRITYSLKNGIQELQNILIRVLNDLIEELIIKSNIRNEEIYFITVAANAMINHSFVGVNLSSFSKYPFKPVFKTINILPNNLNLNINKNAKIFIIPNIYSFVGGDITSDIIALNFGKKDKIELLIDIGTNGEIVLNKKGELIATSTAAGPAFEGAKIKFGMIASKDAISSVKIINNKIELEIIGNSTQPIGICGTGLIDAIASFREKEWIDKNGKISENIPSEYLIDTDKLKAIRLTDKIHITQNDIREFQLAKSAIFTGITLLLNKYKLSPDQIDTFYISGAFGNFLNIDNSLSLKIFPVIKKDKIKFTGNSSLSGAKMILINKELLFKSLQIVNNIKFLDLAKDKEFQDIFINSLNF